MFSPLETVRIPLSQALGRYAAEEVRALHAVPPFANTAMDGYAVRSEDTAGAPCELICIGRSGAGNPLEMRVGRGEAIRIMTGAPMPEGADAVVVLEDTAPGSTRSGSGGTVVIRRRVYPGDNVREPGEDIAEGEVVIQAGTLLRPAWLGVLASIGHGEISVYRRPKVAVLSSGDELLDPGARELTPGAIRDANRPALIGLVTECGCEAVDAGIVPDDPDLLLGALESALGKADVVLTSGGVSRGDYDHMHSVLSATSGGQMEWIEVAIRPAKPLAYGTVGGKPVIGLPGNPVAALVSFELFARPGLLRMQGCPSTARSRTVVPIAHELARRPDGKTHFVRVVVAPGEDGQLVAQASGLQGSHHLAAMARANALAVLPDGNGLLAGDLVEVMLLGHI
jgi:molybdopterin molybdotransferase